SSVHYAAAKGAVISMTLGVAREFAQAGIRCLSISPGPVRTPFQSAAQTSPELVQRFLDDVPMKRFGEPEEIGELVLFLCSDACAFMTAHRVYVNGGGGGGGAADSERRTKVLRKFVPKPASRSTECSSTAAPASRCAGSVCSRTLWLSPPTLGTKIIVAGQS